MILHPSTFKWNCLSPIYEDERDWEFLDQLPGAGFGQLLFATSGGHDFGLFLISKEDIDRLNEEFRGRPCTMYPEDGSLKKLVDAINAHAQKVPSATDQYLFVLDMG